MGAELTGSVAARTRGSWRGRVAVALGAAIGCLIWASGATAQPAGWHVVSSPPVASSATELASVSCTSPSFCVAVGFSDSGGLIETWNGSTWTAASSPSAGDLNGLSCTSPSFCVAAGDTSQSPSRQPLIEMWNGSAWQLAGVPSPGGEEPTLSAVSCSGPDLCAAVGDTALSGGLTGFVERWNGTAWTLQSSGAEFLWGVSCPVGGDCADVGLASYGTYGAPFVGTTSSAGGSGGPSGPSPGSLAAVSCPTPAFCGAAGRQGTTEQPLVETEVNGTWSTASPPGPGTDSVLEGISCTSASFCAAVGGYGAASNEATLAEDWDGHAWSQVASPNPGAGDNTLWGVSCPDAGFCVAVGAQNSSDDTSSQTLVEVMGSAATIGPWKQHDQQAAKADLRVARQNARIYCTPHALGLLGFGAGTLLLGAGTAVGSSLVVAGALTALATEPFCLATIKRVAADYRRYRDPPDPDFEALADPARASRVSLPSCRRWHGSSRAFCGKLRAAEQRWAQDAELAASIDQALATTSSREAAAVAANNGSAAGQQDTHIQTLEGQESTALENQQSAGRAVARLLKARHITYRISTAQSQKMIHAIEQTLSRQQITAAELNAVAPGALKPQAAHTSVGLAGG